MLFNGITLWQCLKDEEPQKANAVNVNNAARASDHTRARKERRGVLIVGRSSLFGIKPEEGRSS